MFSIRITKNGKFYAYLSHRDRKEWSKRQCYRHIVEAKTMPHFKDCEFSLEVMRWVK